MSKYQVGDKFNATLVITYYEPEDDEDYINLRVVDLLDEDGDAIFLEGLTRDNLTEAFDPNYKERMKQLRIKELEKELIKLKGEDK